MSSQIKGETSMRFDFKFTDEQIELINKVRSRDNVKYIKKILSEEIRRYDEECDEECDEEEKEEI